MRHAGKFLAAAVVVGAALLLLPPRAEAGKAPEVKLAFEGRGPGDAPVLVLEGKRLRGVRSAQLRTTGGSPGGTLEVISPGSTQVALSLPRDLVPGVYDVVLEVGKELESYPVRVTLTGGKAPPGSLKPETLSEELRADLDDAERLYGKPASYFRDAGNVEAGTLEGERYSALENLEETGAVSGGRLVPSLFSAWEDLQDEGHATTASALRIAEEPVPEGLLSTGLFSAWADLVAEGRVDGSGEFPVESFSAWESLVAEGRAAGGLLDPSLVDAWGDLQAEGNLDGSGLLKTDHFSAWSDLVEEAEVGQVSGKVAPGVHDHDAAYVNLSGDTMTGPLKVDGGTSVPTGGGAVQLDGTYSTILEARTYGAAPASVGLWAENGSSVDGSAAVLVEHKSGGAGVTMWAVPAGLAGSLSTTVAGVSKATTGTNYGIRLEAVEGSGAGIAAAIQSDPTSVIIRAETKGGGGTALVVRGPSTSGNLARFLDYSNYPGPSTGAARIDGTGKGYFDGGTQTSGADFAESVRASATVRLPEAGDVVVIDRKATRGFALCTERCSRLVAGVVSTKPGILATPRAVASTEAPADEVPLAIAGIVPVKVCDENGPLAAGDELVSASRAGYAMKAPADARTGTVVGKALGALREGEGTVEVLLTLR